MGYNKGKEYADKKNSYKGKGKTSNYKGKSSTYKKDYSNKPGSSNTRPNAKEMRDEDCNYSGTRTQYESLHTNDISWYNKTPYLYNEVTRVPFNRIMGAPVRNTGTNNSLGFTAPGIMTFDYIPGVGYADSPNSPLNRCFTSIYGDIYSKTTGAMQFQQSSLAMFTMSMDSIVGLIAEAKRVLGISKLWVGTNYYYPKHLIQALGFDPDTIMGKQDIIRAKLNMVIANLNGLKIPDFIDLFKRHYSLNGNVWADENSPDAQLYAFRPSGYYQYSDITTTMNYVGWDGTFPGNMNGRDINVFIDKIDELLEGWRSSSDLGIIAGSIQRAYADSQLMRIAEVTLDDQVVPVYDKVMLYQINNAHIMGESLSDLSVTQDIARNLLMWQPKYKPLIGSIGDKTSFWANNTFLNSFDGDTSPEFIMEATRLKCLGNPIWKNANQDMPTDGWDLRGIGTELITVMRLWYLTYDNSEVNPLITSKAFTSTFPTVDLRDTNHAGFTSIMESIGLLTKFNHAPLIYPVFWQNDTDGWLETRNTMVGDLYKFTTLDYDAMYGLTEAALQSLYQVNIPTRI